MGASHGQYMAALQDVFGQPLRAAGVRRPRVQYGLHQRVSGCAIGQARPADDISDDKHIGLERHLVGAIAFDQLDAQRAQLVAHGRVNAGVAAGNPVARLACQRCQTTHERSANAENVNMHASILSRRPSTIFIASPRPGSMRRYQKRSDLGFISLSSFQ